MKSWIQKLINQFDVDLPKSNESLGEDRATLLFIIDTLNKHLLEVEGRPVRKTREILDEFAQELLSVTGVETERILFRLRQFYSRYRIDEYSYVQRTFEDFRSIIWDFVDQLSDDLQFEREVDGEIRQGLDDLKQAVEANSIDELKQQSREFIDNYVEYQVKKDSRRSRRIEKLKTNMDKVKKKLVEARQSMMLDHLTQAYNRKSFDEQIRQYWNVSRVDQSPMSLVLLDIDHFKKVNDSFGHASGDFVLVELVKMLHESCGTDKNFVARIGGEEFAILLPYHSVEKAAQAAEIIRKKVEAAAVHHNGVDIRFTISLGIAELALHEPIDRWIKRADQALYKSKNSGRNKSTIASLLEEAA